MDHSYPYIASLTREPFLFYQMRSTAKLMVEGNSDDAIVKEIVDRIFSSIQRKNLSHAWQKPASNGFMHWKMNLGFCDCFTANRCSKTDLSVCVDEAESTGLGIYADRHWREVQDLRDTSFGKIDLNTFFMRLQEQNDTVAGAILQ